MIPDPMLGLLRQRLARFLTDTCTIEAQSTTLDAYGTPINAWTVVAEDVPCRVIDTRSRQAMGAQEVSAQEAMIERYRLILPYSYTGTLAIDQRVTVNGQTYHVTELVTARTDATDAQAVLTRARTN